jgi:hypothetical protein
VLKELWVAGPDTYSNNFNCSPTWLAEASVLSPGGQWACQAEVQSSISKSAVPSGRLSRAV